MNERTRRAVLGAAIPVSVVTLGLAPYLAYRSDLPDRVASHYGISGTPDGSMTPEQFLIVVGTLMVLGSGACVSHRPHPEEVPADGRADPVFRRCVRRDARRGDSRRHRHQPVRTGPVAGRLTAPLGHDRLDRRQPDRG